MNFLSIIAFLMAAAVFLAASFLAMEHPQALVDPHGALIVIGGTIAATSVSFQVDRVFMMLKVFWLRTILGKKPNYVKIIQYLMKLAAAYRDESPELKSLVDKCEDPFMKEAITVLMDNMLDGPRLLKVLKNRVETISQRYSTDAARFRSIGKFPPAMGLMGAVLGMIALLGSLGKPGAEESIGPSMSVALVATLYGIAFANLIVIPIGENLTELAKEIKAKNIIIVQGIALIAEKTNPLILAEELNSYLLPSERIDWKKIAA